MSNYNQSGTPDTVIQTLKNTLGDTTIIQALLNSLTNEGGKAKSDDFFNRFGSDIANGADVAIYRGKNAIVDLSNLSDAKTTNLNALIFTDTSVNVTLGAKFGGSVQMTDGDDVLTYTGSNNLTVDMRAGSNSLQTGDGSDSVQSGSGADTIKTGAGNDAISSGDGNDNILAGGGNDTVVSGNGNNIIDGGAGRDNITTGNGNNTIDGAAGTDNITTGNGNNFITGGGGDDTISTGDGMDTITGGVGNDSVSSGKGNDTVVVWGGNDSVSTGGGNDMVIVRADSDTTNNIYIDGGFGTQDMVFVNTSVANVTNSNHQVLFSLTDGTQVSVSNFEMFELPDGVPLTLTGLLDLFPLS